MESIATLILLVANNKYTSHKMNSTKAMDVHSRDTGVYDAYTNEPRNSQDRVIQAQFEKYLRPYILIILFLSALLALEFYRWYTLSPPLPGVFLGLFLIGLTYTASRIHEYRDHLRFIQLGRKGEPEVLDVLKKFQINADIQLFKEIKFGSYKVDYILSSKAGVFLINKINWYAPINTEAVVQYNDDEILLNGYRPEANPIVWQKNVAAWLTKKLNKGTSQSIRVKAIVVLPGWFVKTPQESTSVKVMNPRELETYLLDNANILSENEKRLLDYQLEKLISSK